MDLIARQWISGSVCRSTIGWRDGDRIPARKKITSTVTVCCRQLPRVLEIVEFGWIWAQLTPQKKAHKEDGTSAPSPLGEVKALPSGRPARSLNLAEQT